MYAGNHIYTQTPDISFVQTGTLASEDTGVYVGIQQMEYGGQAARHQPVMSAYTATGQPFSVAAGRVSFSFGFNGPAVSCLCEDEPPVARMQTQKPKHGSEPASVGPGRSRMSVKARTYWQLVAASF